MTTKKKANKIMNEIGKENIKKAFKKINKIPFEKGFNCQLGLTDYKHLIIVECYGSEYIKFIDGIKSLGKISSCYDYTDFEDKIYCLIYQMVSLEELYDEYEEV